MFRTQHGSLFSAGFLIQRFVNSRITLYRVWLSPLTNSLGRQDAWLLESHISSYRRDISLSERDTLARGAIFLVCLSCSALLDPYPIIKTIPNFPSFLQHSAFWTTIYTVFVDFWWIPMQKIRLESLNTAGSRTISEARCLYEKTSRETRIWALLVWTVLCIIQKRLSEHLSH